jgi:hypothetical protein
MPKALHWIGVAVVVLAGRDRGALTQLSPHASHTSPRRSPWGAH